MSKLFIWLVLLIPITYFIVPNTVYAQANNSFVTIVNPLRISRYTKNYLNSFDAEYNQIQSHHLPATWLVTYDVLTRDAFVGRLKNLSSNQELGIFLEVTPSFAHAAGVMYNKTDSWHRATSLFLTGYSQADRKKLIDTVFALFKEKFGYYPVSVGGWWVDAYSLSYMKDNYGITGTLGISDQYDLDGYQVWGTWWSVPYYPSKLNAAFPADTTNNKLDIVAFRWAARDPLNGYQSPSSFGASLYSLQDYSSIGLPDMYFQNLLQLYAMQQSPNTFGHATIGLEGDLDPQTYTTQFAKELDFVKQLSDKQLISIVPMKDFSKWYKDTFPTLSPNHIIQSDDLLGQHKKILWFQSTNYRIGLVYNSDNQTTQVVDLRTYPEDFEEPFLQQQNKQLSLSINIPFVIDSIIQPSSLWSLYLGQLKSINQNTLQFEKGNITFNANNIIFPHDITFPETIKTSSLVNVQNNELSINNSYPVSPRGITFHDYSLTIPFTLKRRFSFLSNQLTVSMLVIVLVVLGLFMLRKQRKTLLISALCVIVLYGWYVLSNTYYISQTEYDGLTVLKRLPRGNVLVYDKDCLNCTYSTQYKSAAMAGKKSYVSWLSKQPEVQDVSFLLSKTSQESRAVLQKKDIQYIYLSKYEGYIETLPYLPQDLKVQRVYENANAEIWRVMQ